MHRKTIAFNIKKVNIKQDQEANKAQKKFIQNLQYYANDRNFVKANDSDNNTNHQSKKERRGPKLSKNKITPLITEQDNNQQTFKQKIVQRYVFDIPQQYKGRQPSQQIKSYLVNLFKAKQPLIDPKLMMKNQKFENIIGKKAPPNFLASRVSNQIEQNQTYKQSNKKQKKQGYQNYPFNKQQFHQQKQYNIIRNLRIPKLDEIVQQKYRKDKKSVNYLDFLCDQQVELQIQDDEIAKQSPKSCDRFYRRELVPIVQDESYSEQQNFIDQEYHTNFYNY